MNYRHVYHVGNIGDVLKHAVLARLILYFQKKDKAFRLIDTHAGIGRYDLGSEEAQKTGEWTQGIGKILEADLSERAQELLAPWLDVVKAENPNGGLTHYPGSPLLARKMLRKQDRLTVTELHPQDFKTLSELFAGDIQVKAIHLDAWLAMGSFLPPKEKRGLVIIDPPFEKTDEFELMTASILKGWKKWPIGTYAIWYPLKNEKAITRMHRAFEEAGIRDVLQLELKVAKSSLDSSMMGSAMTIINPPFTLKDEMRDLLPELCDILRTTEEAGWSVEQIIAE